MFNVEIGLAVKPTDTRIFAKLLPDTQVPQWHYRCRSYDMGIDIGVPQMVPFNPRDGTKMTEEWQWFLMNQQLYYMFGLENFNEDPSYNYRHLSRDNRDRITKWFNVVFDDHRFLTNDRGVNNCRNYITGERLDKQLPMIWEVACAVNTIELVSTRRIMTQNSEWYEVKTLKGDRPPSVRDINYKTSPEFIHVAVTWQKAANGTYSTGDFPQVWNAFGYNKHSLYPLVSPEGKVLVETSRVKILPTGVRFTTPFEI
jgi:hypothetical protein